MQQEKVNKIFNDVMNGNSRFIAEDVSDALDSGIPAKTILDDCLIASMDFTGKKFAKREIFLPDVLLSAKTMKLGIGILKPFLAASEVKPVDNIVIGTVQGDLHDIGKNLVGIMLEGAGFRVIDLGNDVPPGRFVDKAISENARIIGMSALLTTTMPAMRRVVDIIREGNYNNIRVIIGGAPVSEEYARKIGANAYSYDASNAVSTVKKLLSV